MSKDINFASEFSSLNCSGCSLDENSNYLIQVNDLDNAEEIRQKSFSLDYNSVTEIGILSWNLNETIPPRTKRYFL